MKRSDRKKNEFKSKVKHHWRNYRMQIIVASTMVALVIIGFFSALYVHTRETDDVNVEPEYTELIEEKEYDVYVVEGEDPYLLLSGNLDEQDVVTLQYMISSYEGAELPTYLVEDLSEIDSNPYGYEAGVLIYSEWMEDNRAGVRSYISYPSITEDVSAVYDWDIHPDDSGRLPDTEYLLISGYIDSDASNTDSIAQFKGLATMVENENEDVEFEHQVFRFRRGTGTVEWTTENPNVIAEYRTYNMTSGGS